jgi:F-type H+-transporting ATPase subunit delta
LCVPIRTRCHPLPASSRLAKRLTKTAQPSPVKGRGESYLALQQNRCYRPPDFPGRLRFPRLWSQNISIRFGDNLRVETSGGIQASLAGRYATALFDLARESGAIAAVTTSLGTLKAALAESVDLAALTVNPLLSRTDAAKGIAGVAKHLKLDGLSQKFLGVLAQNRRLTQLGPVIAAFEALAADHRGEASADVTSAHPLDAAQVKALTAQLKAKVGREVAVKLKVDPSLLGGLVVKIGSQMIDSSIKTRLNTLATAMKG